jgi:hypothetical protein
MIDVRIEPCPFCGHETPEIRDVYGLGSWIECRYCAATGPHSVNSSMAAIGWNTRVSRMFAGEEER